MMASCKTYGQKTFDNGRGLSVGGVHSVIGLKFSSLINSDLTWKGVAKGNRSSSRRARNSLCRSWTASEELLKIDSSTVDTPFSESEKLGVSVLGCRFSDNADHVLNSRSQSSSPRLFSQHPKQNKKPLKNQPEAVNYTSCPGDLDRIVDTESVADGKNLEMGSELLLKEDFSGILMLADAACNDGFRGGDNHVEWGSGCQERCAEEGLSMKNDLRPSLKRVLKEEVNSVEMSSEVTGSSISTALTEEFTDSARRHSSSTSGILQANDATDEPMGDSSKPVLEDPLTKQIEERDGVHEFSMQDDRSHWDLNTPMDDWGCPLDHPIMNSNIADGVPKDVKCGNYNDKIGSSNCEIIQLQGKPQGSSMRQCELRLAPAESGGLANEQSLDRKELKLESGTDGDRNSCSQEKLYSPGYADFVSTGSATVSTGQCKSASADSAEIGKSICSHQVAGSNSCVDNSLPLKSSQSISSCISKATSDTAAPGVTYRKNEDGCAAIKCETIYSGLQVEDVTELAHCATCSINNTHGIQDVNEDANDATKNSLCQSSEIGILPCPPIGVEKPTRGPEVDNDSQYEDGEVRESLEYTWQEYDGEDIGIESQTLNFVSGSEGNMTNRDFQTHSGRLERKNASNVVKNTNTKPKVGIDKLISDGAIGSGMDDRRFGAVNDSGWKDIYTEGGGGLGSIDRTRMFESRAFRRESFSGVGEQPFRNASFRKDRDRFTQHLYSRAQGLDHLVDSRESSRGIKRHHSPKYHGSISSYRLGPPRRMHRRLRKSESPDSRDDDLGTRLRLRPSRNRSPSWGVTLRRGRSIRYGLQVQERGTMNRYHDVVIDDSNGSSITHLHHPSAKRERSRSPIKRRNLRVHRSPSKSSSRSRSHSSSMENPHFRSRSKSPNFGSATRTRRRRTPNQRPGIFADHLGRFRSAPRSYGSPPCSSRWITERKGGAVNFREQSYNKYFPFLVRRSQGRYVQQDDRSDLVDSPRSYISTHTGRYLKAGRAGGRGLRYEESDDDRGWRRSRWGVAHRMKQYDSDESVKRFHSDSIDGYDSRYRDIVDFCGRGNPKCHGINSQIGDDPRKDRGSFKYEKGKI